MAKGKSRRGREDKKPKQTKAAPAPVMSFSKGLTPDTATKLKKA
ncbi:hypothetical protein [Pararhodobacter aggregans]